jgi:hypothetical protein
MHSASRTTKAPSKTIPPLRNGDFLSVAEFERRYEAMPEVKKAELIGGIVYMGSPVSVDHGSPHMKLVGWLAAYEAFTPGVEGGDNTTVRLGKGRNQPQPDALLRILPEFGGQSQSKKGYIVGAPEMAAEVAFSTASLDLHSKLAAYESNGVQEYIVWRVEDEAVDWFVLRAGKFARLKVSADGIYRSTVFPGLWLDAKALIARDLAGVLRVVQQGIASPEHARFVTKLQAKKK